MQQTTLCVEQSEDVEVEVPQGHYQAIVALVDACGEKLTLKNEVRVCVKTR